MFSFQFYMPTKVLYGAGQLKNLHKEQLPGKKAIVVTSNGSSTKKYGYLDALTNELTQAGVEYVVFDEVRANPTRENCMDGAAKAKAEGCDFVVGLGGGSVLDASKMIAGMMTNEGDLWDYSLSAQGGKKWFPNNAAPFVAVSMSAGTGSEMDFGGVVSDDARGEKTALFHPSMQPVISVVDSDLTLSVPAHFTAFQGIDAFFHAAETMLNKNLHPMAEMFALKTIELVAANLPKAYADGQDREARAAVHLASSLAGYYMMITSEHAMEHAMGSHHENLPHGAGLSMIAPAYFGFFADRQAAEEPMKKMARAMGVENPQSGKDFITALNALLKKINCDELKMSDYGITAEEVKQWPEALHKVLGGDITADPLPLSDADYLAIFEASYK